jgi:hypothetical protein
MDYCFITLHGFVFSRISSPEEFQTFLRNEFISIQNKDLSEENAKEILILMKKALWWNDSSYIKQLCMSVNSFFTWGPNTYIVEAINCKAWNVISECLKQIIKAKVKFDCLHFLNLMDVDEIGLLFLSFIEQDELYYLSYFLSFKAFFCFALFFIY